MRERTHWAPEPFPSTHWSVVLQASQAGDAAQRQSLSDVILRYLPPLQSHLIGRWRLAREQADDILQSFIAEKILDRDIITRADPARGKFRTFLLTALDRFVIDEWRKENVRKLPADAGPAADIHDNDHLCPTNDDFTHVFELNWAREVLGHVLRRMHAECLESGRGAIWTVYEARVLKPAFDGDPPVPYDQLIKELKLRSPKEAFDLFTQARRLFNQTLRAVVGEYVEDPSQIEDEIREIRAILSGSHA